MVNKNLMRLCDAADTIDKIGLSTDEKNMWQFAASLFLKHVGCQNRVAAIIDESSPQSALLMPLLEDGDITSLLNQIKGRLIQGDKSDWIFNLLRLAHFWEEKVEASLSEEVWKAALNSRPIEAATFFQDFPRLPLETQKDAITEIFKENNGLPEIALAFISYLSASQKIPDEYQKMVSPWLDLSPERCILNNDTDAPDWYSWLHFKPQPDYLHGGPCEILEKTFLKCLFSNEADFAGKYAIVYFDKAKNIPIGIQKRRGDPSFLATSNFLSNGRILLVEGGVYQIKHHTGATGMGRPHPTHISLDLTNPRQFKPVRFIGEKLKDDASVRDVWRNVLSEEPPPTNNHHSVFFQAFREKLRADRNRILEISTS